MNYKILTHNQPKMNKVNNDENSEYYNVIMHFAPAKSSGYQVCPSASPECIRLCLNESGHGGMFKTGETTNVVQEKRKWRTRYYFEDRKNFMLDLISDINRAIKYADKKGLKLAVRLNGTSDLNQLAFEVAEMFPNVQFYDYTKNLKRLKVADIPANLHYTVSRSELNENEALALIDKFNVAVVFKLAKGEKTLPLTYKGYKVIDGDKDDLRFLDEKGVIVGLKVKGNKAKKEDSPFFVGCH